MVYIAEGYGLFSDSRLEYSELFNKLGRILHIGVYILGRGLLLLKKRPELHRIFFRKPAADGNNSVLSALPLSSLFHSSVVKGGCQPLHLPAATVT
jgi:hypothetical protein